MYLIQNPYTWSLFDAPAREARMWATLGYNVYAVNGSAPVPLSPLEIH